MAVKLVHERCSGCRACQLVCSLTHYKENNPKYAALDIKPHFPAPGTYEVRICTQCGVCADNCPVEAIYKTDDVYKIDAEKCINCGTCVQVCPLGVMFTHINLNVPIKCDVCRECEVVCPRDVISFS